MFQKTLAALKPLILIGGLLFCAPVTLKAQIIADTTEHWQIGGNLNINFSQVALENWTGGGQSSISTNGLLHFSARYAKGGSQLVNSFDLGYGLTRQGGSNARFRKSDDRLQIRSTYLEDLGEKLELAGSLDFQTAITKGYDYPDDNQKVLISDFMAPGYLVTSVGLKYSPFSFLKMSLSPVTGKTTFMLNDQLSDSGSFGVPAGQKVRQELGSNFYLEMSGNLAKSVSYQTAVRFFSSYNHPAEIDVNWDGQLNLKVNDFMTTQITVALIYDEEVDVTRSDGTVGPAVQFKEVLAVGFTFNL